MKKNDTSHAELRKSLHHFEHSRIERLHVLRVSPLSACEKTSEEARPSDLILTVNGWVELGGHEINICDRLLNNESIVQLAQEMANLPELQSFTFENN